MLMAQFPAVGHKLHVPLLAGRVNWPYRPDLIYTCPNPVSQEPRVVGLL